MSESTTVPEKLMNLFICFVSMSLRVWILIRLLYWISLAWIPIVGTSNGTRKVDESVLLLCFDVFESVNPDQTALLDQSGLDPYCRNQ